MSMIEAELAILTHADARWSRILDATERLVSRHDLIERMLFRLKCAGELETAILLADQVHVHWSQSPGCFFVLGGSAAGAGDPPSVAGGTSDPAAGGDGLEALASTCQLYGLALA